jgi:serine acetyltransferase
VWIGDSAIIGKGVHLGDNAVIGAGAIVVKDIPANAIAVGNPASVIKYLDADKPIKSRSQWMADPQRVAEYFDAVERIMREGNTLFGWFRSSLFPRKGD